MARSALTERAKTVQLLAYAYAARLRDYRSRPYPLNLEAYRRAINFRMFLDEHLACSTYSYCKGKGWDFDRFCQTVLREARKYNCGPVQPWEHR